MDRGLILAKQKDLSAKEPWLTGKVGIDLGRNGSRPLDLNPRAGAKGGDNRGAEVRRTAALGRGLTGVGVLDAPGSIWLGTWTGSTSTPRRTRLGHPHGVLERGQSSRRRAAERQRQRAKPWGEKRECEEERVGELHNLDAKLLGDKLVDGKQWNGVTAAGSESSTRQRG